jgi:hypothetical protein
VLLTHLAGVLVGADGMLAEFLTALHRSGSTVISTRATC